MNPKPQIPLILVGGNSILATAHWHVILFFILWQIQRYKS